MPIRNLTSPKVAPVAIEMALRHLRALDEEADMVQFYLMAATEAIEDYTGRALLKRQLLFYTSRWPFIGRGHRIDYQHLQRDTLRSVDLNRSPLVSVESVKYWADQAQDIATLDASNYKVDLGAPFQHGRVVFEDDYAFPDIARRSDAVQIAFTAGYGDTSDDVPFTLRNAVLTFARNLYDNPVPIDANQMIELPFSLRHALRSMRIESMGSVISPT